MKPVTLLLADDHVVVREGLRSMLVGQADFRVVGEAADGRQAVVFAREVRPDILLMDIAMPLLTPREREVLQLIAEGHANKQVAAQLGLSSTHREHIMAKLDIHDTAGLTRYAMDAGIIESGIRGRLI